MANALSKHFYEEKKKKRGVHSKNKSSISKASKFYKKKYRGQGKKR
tara:strand:- start:1371 stop:1508 length:138 start_codon:yes stop_codon:yes gene_type:complete